MISRFFPPFAVASLAGPFFLGWGVSGTISGALSMLLWAGLVRMMLLHHVTWSVNSICHMFGKQPAGEKDHSTNFAPLAILSFGESWHNFHHAHPACARHGALPHQIDPSAAIIRAVRAGRLGHEGALANRPARSCRTAPRPEPRAAASGLAVPRAHASIARPLAVAAGEVSRGHRHTHRPRPRRAATAAPTRCERGKRRRCRRRPLCRARPTRPGIADRHALQGIGREPQLPRARRTPTSRRAGPAVERAGRAPATAAAARRRGASRRRRCRRRPRLVVSGSRASGAP